MVQKGGQTYLLPPNLSYTRSIQPLVEPSVFFFAKQKNTAVVSQASEGCRAISPVKIWEPFCHKRRRK